MGSLGIYKLTIEPPTVIVDGLSSDRVASTISPHLVAVSAANSNVGCNVDYKRYIEANVNEMRSQWKIPSIYRQLIIPIVILLLRGRTTSDRPPLCTICMVMSGQSN